MCTPVQLWATPGGQTATYRPLPPTPPKKEGWRAVSPSGSCLVRGDQCAAGSLGAPLPRVLLGHGSAQHAPGPSFYWDAPSRSGTLCNAACDPLGQSRSTTRPVRPSGVQSWAGGSCRSPDPQTPSAASGRAPTPRCWGPEHRAHTTPHTRQPRPAGERQKVCPCHESPPPPQGPPMARAPTHTGTAVSPSRQRLDEVRGSSAVWAAVRPDNRGGTQSSR